MTKSVNIDGKDYLIRSCYKCPFYDNGDDSWGRHCQYPVNPSMKVEADDFQPYMDELADDCPLGFVKDCGTCKHEATRGEWVEPCCQCMVSWNSATGKESTPTKWEMKE